jgi:hypothetical protein
MGQKKKGLFVKIKKIYEKKSLFDKILFYFELPTFFFARFLPSMQYDKRYIFYFSQ